MKWTYFILLFIPFVSLSCSERTAKDHFHDVVDSVSNKRGMDLSFHGVYPGMSREEALSMANVADKVLKAQQEPSLKESVAFEMNEPKMKVDIRFVNFGKAIPETRDNNDIRSHSATVMRLAPNNGYFDKKIIFDEIEAELGNADKDDSTGMMHTLYFGYYPNSNKQLTTDCLAEFAKAHPDSSPPIKEVNYTLPAEVTINTIQFVMDTCPAILDVYKETKIRQLSPWLWITFNEKQRYMNVMMNYQGEAYFSPQNPKGPLFHKQCLDKVLSC
jgi:hypothetical protein